MAIINSQFQYVPDPSKGKPLAFCQLFVGVPDLDPEIEANQVQLSVVQEDGTLVGVDQPFIFSAGGVAVYEGSTVRLDVDGNYSIKVLDKNDVQTYYVHNVLEGDPTLQSIARSLNILDSDIIYSTDTTTPIPGYIYDQSQEKTYLVPDDALGKFIDSVLLSTLNTTFDGPYVLTPASNFNFNSVTDMIGQNLSTGSVVETQVNASGESIASKWIVRASSGSVYNVALNNGLFAELTSRDGDLRHYDLVDGGDIYAPLVAAIDGGKKTIKIPKLATAYTLSQNFVRANDYIRLWFEQETEVKLLGGAFSQLTGAIELTGNDVKISGGLLITTDGVQEVTPLRVGNTAYGAGDATRRKGIKIKSVRMVDTGYGNPNHGNFVIIGALSPDLSFIRLEGAPTSNGNFEVLGVKGGSARDCVAENGLLGNFHATSADSNGFPCEDFTFERCEAFHTSALVSGDNCYKFSRNCKKVKAINCKGTSIASGGFVGNDSVFFLQGVQKCAFIDCDVFMQNNGQFNAAYAIHDHGESLTGASDNTISGGTVEINTPGLNNRVLLMFEAFNLPISRNTISNIKTNIYNGSVDALVEMSGTNSGLISDNTIEACSGTGTSNAALARLNVGVTWLSGNKMNGVIDNYITSSGEVKQILDVSAPNWLSAVYSGAGTITIPLPNENRNDARMTMSKNNTGGTVNIEGFDISASVTIEDGYQVTLSARFDTSQVNAVNLIDGGVGKFRLAGSVDFTFAAWSAITLQSAGADWVEVSRRA